MNNIVDRLKSSKLFTDSFWAVSGNAVGYGLLLISGIIIARFLGSEDYGEYGVVKTTMFNIAAFATLGLGVTSTRYVSQYVEKNIQYVKSLINYCELITLFTSGFLAFLIIIFAKHLAIFLDEPHIATPLRFLGIVIVLRALNTTQLGILGGLKAYHSASINNVVSGVTMLLCCLPLSYYYHLNGALIALTISQLANYILNRISIQKRINKIDCHLHKNFFKELITFSFPVALQETTFFLQSWGGIIILTKFSSLSEVGLFTASSQWCTIILFIPNVLTNVVLSHLSSNIDSVKYQMRTMKRMLTVNAVSTVIPFLIVWCLSGYIATLYGPSFTKMPNVLNLLIFSTIFTCCTNVFRSEYIAIGANWILLMIRSIKDVVFLLFAYYLITHNNGINAAFYFALATMLSSILNFLLSGGGLYVLLKRKHVAVN